MQTYDLNSLYLITFDGTTFGTFKDMKELKSYAKKIGINVVVSDHDNAGAMVDSGVYEPEEIALALYGIDILEGFSNPPSVTKP